MMKLTIARRLSLGFGVLTFAVLASSIMMYLTLNTNREISDKITEVYSPSLTELNNLFVEISNSKMLIKNWVFIETKSDTPDKKKLKKLHASKFPQIKKSLASLSQKWSDEDRKIYNEVIIAVEDTLFGKHKMIMGELNNFDNYQDPMILMVSETMAEEGGEVINATDNILKRLESLLNSLNKTASKGSEEMIESFDSFQFFIILVGFVLFIGALIIALLTVRSIVKPINFLRGVLFSMSKGILPEKSMKVNNDEIGEMTNALNAFIDGQKETSEFSVEIGKGNFDTEYTPLSEHDSLGNSLLDMRENLKNASSTEKERKQEDEQRNWVTRGLAQFADILRMNNDDMTKLSYNIVSSLVKYLGANQGGMFIVNDDIKNNVILELTSAYAFERRKSLQKTIRKGEGIIGTVLLEKHTVYMTDIPDTYINITSGLGMANPRSLLIVPLKLNEVVYGVIEVASFKQFEPYQIEFIEKVGESIASTISAVKINNRTAKLLRESKEQGEQLIQQEEEMRQNLEELQSIQEESARKITDLESQVNEINNTIAIFELDLNGTVLNVNEQFTRLLNLSYDNFVGKPHQLIISTMHFNANQYQEMIDELSHGFRRTTENVYETPKGEIQLHETYTPIKDNHGQYFKIMVAVFDITKYKTLDEI